MVPLPFRVRFNVTSPGSTARPTHQSATAGIAILAGIPSPELGTGMDGNKKYLFVGAKDPDETLDYLWDWSAWLGADTISTSEFTVSPSGLVIESDNNSDKTSVVWLSGGTAGLIYDVTNRITTVAGRTADRTALIVCQQR